MTLVGYIERPWPIGRHSDSSLVGPGSEVHPVLAALRQELGQAVMLPGRSLHDNVSQHGEMFLEPTSAHGTLSMGARQQQHARLDGPATRTPKIRNTRLHKDVRPLV